MGRVVGSFNDTDLLVDSRTGLVLKKVYMTLNGVATGLDATEHLIAPKRAQGEIRFIGRLKIEDLSWLSPEGHARLEARVMALPPCIPLSQLAVLGRAMLPTVELICKKETPAMYMTSSDFRNDLVLSSAHGHRPFRIRYLSEECAAQSTNFIERYEWVKAINDLVGSTHFGPLAPNKLMEWRREERARTVKPPHKPDHISHAEMRKELSPHAAWLLAYFTLGRNMDTLDVPAWCDFIHDCEESYRGEPSTWKSAYGLREPQDVVRTLGTISKVLARFCYTPTDWLKRLQRVIGAMPVIPRGPIQLPVHSQHISVVLPRRDPFRALTPTYDLDFEDASTSGESDSEDEEAQAQAIANWAPPTFFAFFMHPPRFRLNSFIWECPVPRCEHTLNFLNLPRLKEEDNLDKFVLEARWNTTEDVIVQRVLNRRVYDHYCDHLRLSSDPKDEERDKAHPEKMLAALAREWPVKSRIL
uniref:Uncharacterized protein n=1 Tax=Mycena chlorophos TaxID=658473 RepID=A0ABQ0KWK7_MYCCL|nr:predicted protein [Mycena chlorophos]